MEFDTLRRKIVRLLEDNGARLEAYTDEPGNAVIALVVQCEDGITGECDLYE